ncbi:MAG: RnfABCDGE type electron transport complex subunit G [Bacteroidetes bacterium]|jgi:electron transport complex protein RnfG|nr:RnfABCDGE type electron transport complex subunit G [Bacteroidota bacterium]
MAKKESTISNMVLTLFIVTLVSGASLGFIYEVTKGPIEKAMRTKKNMAIKKVLPDFTNSPVENANSAYMDGDTLYVYKAMENTDTVGLAIETFTPDGFSGMIKLMVGFLPDGTIYDIAVLQHKETPGLGDKMATLDFRKQFQGQHPNTFNLQVKKDGGDVDAITASTITSRAFCDAVQRAYEQYKKEQTHEPAN